MKPKKFYEGILYDEDTYFPKIGQYEYDTETWKTRTKPYSFKKYVEKEFALLKHRDLNYFSSRYQIQLKIYEKNDRNAISVIPELRLQVGAFIDNISKYPIKDAKFKLNDEEFPKDNLNKTFFQLSTENLVSVNIIDELVFDLGNSIWEKFLKKIIPHNN